MRSMEYGGWGIKIYTLIFFKFPLKQYLNTVHFSANPFKSPISPL
jgi:hypothetical protein